MFTLKVTACIREAELFLRQAKKVKKLMISDYGFPMDVYGTREAGDLKARSILLSSHLSKWRNTTY